MTETSDIPRRGQETDPVRLLALQLAELRRDVARLGKSASLRNASISDAAGTVRLQFSPDAGALIAYAEDGTEAARFGVLANTAAGAAGVEVLAGGEWIRVGDVAAVTALEASVASLQDEAAARDILIEDLIVRVTALEGV